MRNLILVVLNIGYLWHIDALESSLPPFVATFAILKIWVVIMSVIVGCSMLNIHCTT